MSGKSEEYVALDRIDHDKVEIDADIEDDANEQTEEVPDNNAPNSADWRLRAQKFMWIGINFVWGLAKSQFFLILMCLVILIAYFTPWIGRRGGVLRTEYTVNYGSIILTFLLSGLTLNIKALRGAVLNIKLNTLIETTIFVITPATAVGVASLLRLGDLFNENIIDGFIVMACQPTSIASCAILTLSAGGEETLAIANSIVANVAGVFISPALITWLLGQSIDIDISEIFLKLGVTVLIPMAVGLIIQLVFPRVPSWLREHIKLSAVSQILLLLMVYSVFCETFSQDLQLSGEEFVFVVLLIMFGHAVFLLESWLLPALPFLKFSRKERVAALFTGSQKTLALGISLINIIYGGTPNVGLVTIPLLVYHPLQLTFGGFITPHLKKWVAREVQDTVPASEAAPSSGHLLLNMTSEDDTTDDDPRVQ